MLLLMIERGMPIDIVLTADTGMEFPEMYDHLAKLDEYLYRERGIHLTMLRHPKGFEYMMFEEEKQKISSIENRQKLGVPLYGNGWPGVKVRWCTGQLKTHLISKEVNRLKGEYQALHYVGIAADEPKRIKNEQYPLVDWGITEAEALKLCYDRGYDWGGLYEIYHRCSCWCCPLQRIDELRKLRHHHPELWKRLRDMDQRAIAQFGHMKHELTKYFKHRMKLELSQEKTYVTDLRKNGIHFLGYIVKAERKRKTPDPATWSDNLVGKPFPDMERLTKKIHTLQKEVRKIGLYTQSNTQAAQIQYVNSVIMGLAQYLQPSICSHAYHAIDRRVNNTALAVWKNLFPKQYNQMQVPLKELSNLPHRHEGYDSKTFAIQIDGKWFGITYAFITHSRYESKPFDQKMTPYTEDGRRRYVNYRTKHKPLPCDRPSINTPEDIALSIYASGKGWKANFEYFMNREYAYNRDKGKCKCCGRYFSELIPKHCHHVNPRLPIERINKVPNLAWLCIPCHRMVHNSPIPPELDAKAVRKIKKYREKLKK